MAEQPVGEQPHGQWARAREVFASARRVTALTGAGVSTASGIPDFRGPQGVWTRNPESQRLTDISAYVADPEVRKLAWQRRLTHPAWDAAPGLAHRALAELDQAGRLGALITQNIDELHQQSGVGTDRIVELHGTLFATICLDCGATGSMRAALARVGDGEEDPPCRACGGILKSRTVSFGESLDPDILRAAQRAALNCDVFLAAGTSLTVAPASALAELSVRAGAHLIICNAEPTPYDALATAVLGGALEEVLPALVAEPFEPDAAPLRTYGDPGTWS